jgi:hypothetical protein
MRIFRPTSTLLVGIALGVFVVPKALRAVNVNVPGM